MSYNNMSYCMPYTLPGCGNMGFNNSNGFRSSANVPRNGNWNPSNAQDSKSNCNPETATIYNFAGVVMTDNGSSYDYYMKKNGLLQQEKKDDPTATANENSNEKSDHKNTEYVHCGIYTTVNGEIYDCFEERPKNRSNGKRKANDCFSGCDVIITIDADGNTKVTANNQENDQTGESEEAPDRKKTKSSEKISDVKEQINNGDDKSK